MKTYLRIGLPIENAQIIVWIVLKEELMNLTTFSMAITSSLCKYRNDFQMILSRTVGRDPKANKASRTKLN